MSADLGYLCRLDKKRSLKQLIGYCVDMKRRETVGLVNG